ncbi:PASTA domain-containing protein [Pseudonocardia hydrocarbonoxydans]|uniref:PASTA domain-containing protein n=1 Tax=Pseudonocardia hydrocarbonoxydans TaxID=76726 RepID=A0A4Y3WLA9_9PSEU|nr:PASTA domain-containing protein [Pseudonocardia hydrocarbonoxydans]GEC19031.1 hypothetical protein PHY01_13140 [Pseudonocardia hydrocarbonoxydans]
MPRRRIALALLAVAGIAGCASSGPTWTMPDVVGQNLQAAQDAVQQPTGFEVRVTTRDLSGADRTQVEDVEWRVCTQTPEPGAEITRESMVDLGVVRQAEDC